VALSRDARRHDGRNQVEDGNARDERSVNQVGKTNVPGRVPER
jgi:hypothetical protein